jgi:hypothetical protein
MKIAIISQSYHKHNYGAILQRLALQNFLKDIGHNVKCVSLKFKETNNILRKFILFFCYYNNNISFLHFIFDFIYKILYNKTRRITEDELYKCRIFISENIDSTEVVNEYNIGQALHGFDAIIMGSDQIWNALGRKRMTHLFDWEPGFSGLRISYAASGKYSKIPFMNRKKARLLLKKFNAISVRDIVNYNLVYNTAGIKPSLVVDPVLLYNFDSFIDTLLGSEPYIFVYILGDKIRGKGGHSSVISEIKQKYGEMKIIAVVMPEVSLDAESFADEVVYDASPKDWLNLIYHAKFVYTDSFHGCVFSLKFKKNFLGYYSYFSRGARLIDLGKRYQINKYIVSSVEDMKSKRSICESINYDIVIPTIDRYREESVDFLYGALDLYNGDGNV